MIFQFVMLVYQRVFSKVQPFFNQLSQLQAPPWRVTSHTHQAAFPHWSHKLGRPEPADPDTSWIRRRIGDVFMKHGDLYDKHRDNVTMWQTPRKILRYIMIYVIFLRIPWTLPVKIGILLSLISTQIGASCYISQWFNDQQPRVFELKIQGWH